MKFTKMSLVAALLIGSSAFAIENTKVSGNAKLFYSTDDMYNFTSMNDDSLFNKDSSTGEAAVTVGLTTDLTKNVSAGVKGTVISTLGLYNNLVSATWTGGIEDTYVVDEAWLAGTLGKTTVKVGRMPLDTPLVFTETWSTVENTFDAGVVINQDIPDTTLVAAYVGQSDDAAVFGGGISQAKSPFASFYNGAYAAGAINNSFKPLTVQAWYFDAKQAAEAYWLQADLDASSLGVKGLSAGVQYTDIQLSRALTGLATDESNDAAAVMLGYDMKDVAAVKVAYSATGKNNTSHAGAGFNLAGSGQSKLYTEAWWNYGYVTQNDTDALNVTLTSPVQGMFDLGLYYTTVDQSDNAGNNDMDEFTATAGKDFGPLNATLAYVYTKADDQNVKALGAKGSAYNTVQAYLTYNF